ncbi:MAG: hypothetical protein ACOYMG_02940 [Candidatus Methylumidiphilus sp.]
METHTGEDVMRIVEERYKSIIPHEEVHGTFVTLTRFVPLPLDYIFNYLAHVPNLEEFTLSLRNFQPCPGREGLWKGEEHFKAGTKIYLKCVAHRESGCVDHPCAWENSENLWSYYAFRLFDGKSVMNQPGTVVQWTNFRHKNYDLGGPFKELIEAFPRFYEIHGIELDNLVRILEARFKHEYGYLLNDSVPGGF